MSKKDPKNVRAKMIAQRSYLGLSQPEVAKLAGIGVTSYQQYEWGVRDPKIDDAAAIAKALHWEEDTTKGVYFLDLFKKGAPNLYGYQR